MNVCNCDDGVAAYHAVGLHQISPMQTIFFSLHLFLHATIGVCLEGSILTAFCMTIIIILFHI